MTIIERVGFAWYLRRIAHQTAAKGGVTTDVQTRSVLAPRDAWYFPKYPHRTVVLPPGTRLVPAIQRFVANNRGDLCAPDSWLGTWIHPATRYAYLDITTCCVTLDEACQMALDLGARAKRPVVALYNTQRKQVVYLPPFGELHGY